MTEWPSLVRRLSRGFMFEVAETVVLTVLIFLGIQTFVAQPYQVRQVSMEATLLPNQYVLVDKLTPRWASYARGDIVVFDPPEAWRAPEGFPFIKRVIGLPGDRVELRDDRVYVNGAPLSEAYVWADDDGPRTTEPGPDGATSWVVPDGSLFVMGDHRGASADSRSFGPIEISRVIGRAWLRYWPFDTFGVLSTPTYAAAP
jgi:signal peptidase I